MMQPGLRKAALKNSNAISFLWNGLPILLIRIKNGQRYNQVTFALNYSIYSTALLFLLEIFLLLHHFLWCLLATI